MADVTDSKSVGLIIRVGSSPTTGTMAPFRGAFFCEQRDQKNACIWAFFVTLSESRHPTCSNNHPLYRPYLILSILFAPCCHFHLFSIFDPRFCTVYRHFPDLWRPFQGANKSVASDIVEATEKALFLPISLGKMAKSRWLTPPSRNSPNGCKYCWSWRYRCAPATPGCP